MKAPDFWYAKPGVRAALLAPLSLIFAWLGKRRMARGANVAIAPFVICVGNINVGGTGKTPVVMAIAQVLRARGLNVHTLLSGYGGALSGPVLVDERKHKSTDVGDEALLHAGFGPVWVAKDRALGGQAAAGAGAEVVLLDDGLQNSGLAKDLSLVVVDAQRGWGNGRVMPSGPLREPVARGLARTDALVLVGAKADRTSFLAKNSLALPVLEAELRPLATGMQWSGMRCVAFAGIGNPPKFFATLKAQGAELLATHGFDDHAPFAPAVLARLSKQAKDLGAQLVCTEKDMVRLPHDFRAQVTPLPVRLEFEDEAAVAALLDTFLKA